MSQLGIIMDFMDGIIGFKTFCSLSNITFLEGMKLIEESEREPVFPEIIDEYTSKITEENISQKDTSILKNKKGLKRPQ